ncbi:[protein-PII] uridylyltransferase [Demetria terragena]|uniref:[protein-PII] uridylyltransferase n=1 Tax=Demetria terragena TaxID=63959 RepID=UPI000399B8DB|nr:[protein-PII] uridylyltransferase [Demetria terragena]
MGADRRRERARQRREEVIDLFEQGCRDVLGGRPQGVALAAVGSLAREDCGPLSDLDLVLLHDGRSVPSKRVKELADKIWYPLWDSGIQIDHSVRTPAESRKVAADDLSAAIGLLDITHLAGDSVLVTGVAQSVAHDWRSNARTRLTEVLDSVAQRHSRHDDLAHALEPELKEGRGGLRDMSVLRALTAAWLADRPHGSVDAAYERLLDIRDAVHEVSGRGRSRMVREIQDASAHLLGLVDADALLTEAAASARVIAYALDSTTRRAGQAQAARTVRLRTRRPTMRSLGHGLYEHDGEVVLGARTPTNDLVVLLRAATAAAARGRPLAPVTVRNLTRDLPPVETPWPEPVRDALIDLLGTGPGLVQVWESLDLAGAIAHLIPEWKAVASRPQRSPVHRHTVDRHLIETVVEAASRRHLVDRPDILLAAALLHDIGKIEGVEDHAAEGAPVAATIVRRMGFDQEAASAVELLVQEHLSLVDLATRRDPQDPQTVRSVIGAVEERPELLEQLRVLTEADAVAAGPAAWTTWRASLVDQLTTQARRALDGRHVPVREPRAGSFVLSPAASDALLMGEPYVTVTPHSGGATIQVVDRDRLGLFADTAGLLAAHGLLVRSARVRTTERAAVNTWQVEAPEGNVPQPTDFGRALRRLAAGDRAPLAGIRRPQGERDVSPRASRAEVVPCASGDATVIEVRAHDRPGLLQDLGQTLARHGATIRSAHVATYAGQALDTFYLMGSAGRPVEPAQVARLLNALTEAEA